jgi:hypothetical protein
MARRPHSNRRRMGGGRDAELMSAAA